MSEDNSKQETPSKPPSQTSKAQDLLKEVRKFLSESHIFSSFPLSLLLLGLEEVIEIEFFLCPCRSDLNELVAFFTFIGPALFTFALMYLLLRPFRRRCCCTKSNKGIEDNDKNEKNEKNMKYDKNCCYAFVSCLIPPVMWIIILLLDGDYVACGMTDWNGVYVFDNQLNRSWCKPTEETQNQTVLQDLTRKYIHQSQLSGYVMISIFSIVAVVLLGIYDCCTKLLSYCRRLKKSQESQRVGQSGRPLQEQSEAAESLSHNASDNAPSTPTVI